MRSISPFTLRALAPGLFLKARCTLSISATFPIHHIQASLQLPPPPPLLQLDPPSISPISSVLDTSFLLEWSSVANAQGYYVDVAHDYNFSSILPAYTHLDVSANLALQITDLDPATSYFARVTAYNGALESLPSASASTTTYIPLSSAVFIIDPSKPQLFEFSDDLVSFSPCVLGDEIINPRVNRITCPATGLAMTSTSPESALIISKDPGGKFFLTDSATQSWLYSAPTNLLSASGQQITGAAAFPSVCLMHLFGSSIQIGSFVGRSSAFYYGIYNRRFYTSEAEALSKCLLRTIACTSDPADTLILENNISQTPAVNTGILVDSSWFGQDLGSWNNVRLYLWAIYAPTPDPLLIQSRHDAAARYLGGYGGPVIELP